MKQCKHLNKAGIPMTDKPIEPKGRAKGGIATAANMTPEELKERAQKGAVARWGPKPPTATHKGDFIDKFDVDAECYVLDDSLKTAVMTQRGIAAALGLSNPGGKDFQRLVSGKRLSEYLGAEVQAKIAQPIEFKWIYPGAKQNSITIKGYSADILIDVCNAILAADAAGKMLGNQANLAKQSRVILNASAKSGITNLVYALAGYRPEIEHIIQAFKAFVQEEARKYEQEFPNELYMQWQRLYSIPLPVRGKPWEFMHLTRRHIYYPLAKSNGKIYELVKALKAKDGDQKKKLFQFLNEIGARALRMQIGRVLEMSESSKTSGEYEAKIVERFGGQQELDLVVINSPELTSLAPA